MRKTLCGGADQPQSRTVRFELSERALHVSHYGKLFDRQDVEGVCGIALRTFTFDRGWLDVAETD